MPIQLIGKSVLGNLGFCQVPEKMGDNFDSQLKKIQSLLPSGRTLLMTSMTGSQIIRLTDGNYVPQAGLYLEDTANLYNPEAIYAMCEDGLDCVTPNFDFIIWNSLHDNVVATTFSREAPIIAFESENGYKALGVILRPSLMSYGDYLFSIMLSTLGTNITVTLVTCNHYEYPEGSIPSIISELASKYGMECIIPEDSDSEKNPECYHRGESGNHVVAMW